MTQSDRDCLAHIVLDPDAWYSHAVATFGEVKAQSMLSAKVERHWQHYTLESERPDYKTRAELDAADKLKELK